MADKGKRIASRQAQLKRRKRRGKGRPQQFDAGPVERSTPDPDPAPAAPAAESAPAPAARRPTAPRRTAPSPAREPAAAPSPGPAPRRGRAAPRAEGVLTYPHLGTELRHIGALTVVLAGALVALTFLLR